MNCKKCEYLLTENQQLSDKLTDLRKRLRDQAIMLKELEMEYDSHVHGDSPVNDDPDFESYGV